MIKQRNIALCIIFTLITCGIYNLYWIVCLNDEANFASGEDGLNGITVILLSIITCGIFYLFWIYRMGEKLTSAKAKHNLPSDSILGLLYLLLSLFGLSIVAMALIQHDLNTISDHMDKIQ